MADPSHHHGRVLHLIGTGDIEVSEVVCSLLDPGDCFVDIGANYGSIGLLASRKVGADGIIHFVELQPALDQSISAAIDRGPRHAPLEVHAFAVSSRSDTLAIHCADNHTGLATLEPDKLTSRSSQSCEAPVMTTRLGSRPMSRPCSGGPRRSCGLIHGAATGSTFSVFAMRAGWRITSKCTRFVAGTPFTFRTNGGAISALESERLGSSVVVRPV